MIVRELVTKLSFALDKSGLNDSFKGLRELNRKALDMQQSLKKTMGWMGGRTIVNPSKISAAPAKAPTNSVNNRFQEILAYKKEMQSLSVKERREISMLNAAEKQVMREAAAEKRKLDAEEKRRIKELNKEKRKANFLSSLKTINQTANRALLGIFGGATASLGFSYNEYKKYKEKRAEGLIVKTSLTSDQIKQFDAFDKKFSAFKENINSIRNAFATALLPVLQPLIEQFNKWYKANKKVVNTKIKEWAEQLGKAFKKIWEVVVDKIIPAGAWLINVFGGLENVILALIGIKVAGWLASITSLFISLASLVTGPILPILLTIGAFWLLYDEIKVTMEGGESLLKRYAELPYWQQIIDKFKAISESAVDALGLRNVVDKVRAHTAERKALGQFTEKDSKEFVSATNKSGVPLTTSATTPYLSKLFEFKSLATSMPQFDKNALNPFEGFFTNTISSLKSKPYDKTRISDFLTTSMPQNRNTQVTNNVGGIKIVIQNQGTIDENSIPKVTDIIQQQITKAIGDTFAISKAGLVS